MNKRIKKKRELENSLRIAKGAIVLLLEQNKQLWKNERFDKLEAANEKMKLDLDNAVVTFSKQKKSSWFGRK